jgi:squalene-hopene/tetraprenyl-beta-curcumene cyclase
MILRTAKTISLPVLLSLGLLAGACPVLRAAPPDANLVKARSAVVKGLDYLRRTQEQDGSWNEYPATTALAVCAFLRNGKTELKEPAVSRGVEYLLRSVKPNGAIYSDANPATALPNYNTAIALMALGLTRNPAYKAVIRKAQQYLEESQLAEPESIDRANPAYGGIGYGNHPDRPDLSNLAMALQGLKESGVPSDAPVFQKAIVFLQRVQNRTESNDQAWVKDGPKDGGFAYDSTGKTQVKGQSDHASMGAMTYSGLESYIYCGVSKQDPRALAAWNWIRTHYTVTEHPGMGDTSLYYYYHAMAKTLDVYGQKLIKDAKGETHDWALDLAGQIAGQQHPDGSWFNTNSRYWENQPGLVTSYSLISLSFCLKR